MLRNRWNVLYIGSIIVSTGTSFVPSKGCRQYHSHRGWSAILGNTNDDDDSDFYRDLREAKKSKLGLEIPKEQLKESTLSSESEFLQAMKQVKKEFQDAKEKLGLEGAIDMVIGRLRDEDTNDGIQNDERFEE